MLTRHHKSERGQILILIALALVAVIGFTALAIDVSITYDARRSAQNAADSAAMAGALAYVNGQPVETAAFNAAAASGFANNGVDNWVVVNHPPLSGEYAGDDEYIQVIIRNQTDPSFLQVVFSGDMTNQVEAIARARPAEGGTLYGDNAIVTLKPTGKSVFDIGGNSYLEIKDGGIFDNSKDRKAFTAHGNAEIYVEGGVYVVGGYELGSNVDTNTTQFSAGVPPITYEDPQVPPPTKPSAPTCSGSGLQVGNQFYPGNFEEIKIEENGTYTFNRGSYCISKKGLSANGNLTIQGDDLAFYLDKKDFSVNGNVTFTGSNLIFYVADGSFAVNGNINFSGNNLTMFVDDNLNFNGNYEINLSGDTFFYVNSGSFSIGGNANLKTNEEASTLVYLKQGNLKFNGNYDLTAKGVTFYLEKGSLTGNGNSNLNLTAPTKGPYKGLLLYLPATNTKSITINGNSDTTTVGTILAPSSNIKFDGNGNLTEYYSQIICYTLTIQGNFNGKIDFDADQNWQVPGDPFIELPH